MNYLTQGYHFTPDLDAYFARIKYTGPRDANLSTLNAIQWNHLLNIPFENLDIHIRGKVDIAPEDIQKKIVFGGRGGYCYENNIFVMYVLRELGFKVVPIVARTRWQRPTNLFNPGTHLVLKVFVEEAWWMFDVGFSSFGSPLPLKIHSDEVQETPLEPRRVVYEEQYDLYVHQMKLFDGNWHDVFAFALGECFPMDWEVGNYYVYSHPTCFAKLNIIVSKPTTTCRYLLFNKEFKTTYLDGRTDKQPVETEAEYLRIIREVFGLKLSDDVSICPPGMTW